jgi:hypothetical protein
MSQWKIYYVDGSSIQDDKPNIMGDPTKIALPKRFGVHSIIQPMNLPGVDRETIEQYHYLYLKLEDRWIGVGVDGVLDYLIFSLDNIGCVLHGRPMVSDGFFALRQTIAQDDYIPGAA